MKEYLEYKDEKSSKFWQVELDDCDVIITFGKIGTCGRDLTKNFPNAEKATLYYKQQLAKKLKEGYNDPKLPTLTFENTRYYQSNKPFKHYGQVEGIYYFAAKERVISYCKNFFYIWSKEGTLLDTFHFHERISFFRDVYIKQIEDTSRFLFYVRESRNDRIYIFDLEHDSFELIRYKNMDNSLSWLGFDIDRDNQYIYVGHCDGVMLLDYELNIVNILKSPYEEGVRVAVNAHARLVAFVHLANETHYKHIVTLVDMTGKFISEIKTTLCDSPGTGELGFNKEGTRLYILASNGNNYETVVQVWNPQDGALMKQIIGSTDYFHIFSFELFEDEKWLVTRSAGIDIILWNLEKERMEWTRQKQSASGSICFMEDFTFYQADGNRIYKASKDEDVDLEGITSPCEYISYDDRKKQLWVGDSHKVFCYSSEGEIVYQTKTQSLENCFDDKGLSKLLVMKSTPFRGEEECIWLNLNDFQMTPFLSEYFKSITFNEHFVAACDKDGKKVSVWNHNGSLLKQIKIKRCWSIHFVNDNSFLINCDTDNEIWKVDEGKIMFTFKGAVKKVKVHASLPYFITAAENTMKLWDGKGSTPLSVEILAGKVKEIISEGFLDVFLIIDDTGRLYSFNPELLELKVLVNINKTIDKATLSAAGKLYAVTEELEVFELELMNALNRQEIKSCETTESSAGSILSEESLKEDYILQSLQAINWDELSEENFNRLRKALDHIATESGLGEAHAYFTERMLEKGAKLKHQFADRADYSSFAMSSDGKYLAIGTWMNEGEYNEEDGTIQIWEIASGRCVNLLKDYYAGIGWRDYPCGLQWSPDNKRLGAAMNTNKVSSFDPFGKTVKPLATASVTDGWGEPPAWCWVKDSSCFAVSCWGDSKLPLCICKTNKAKIYEDGAKWFQDIEEDSEDELEFEPYKLCYATKNGRLIYGYNTHEEIYAIDIKKGQPVWQIFVDLPFGFSPLDDFFVYLENNAIQIADLNTGEVIESISNVKAVEGFEFAPNSQRYVAYGANKVTLFDYNKKVVAFKLASHLLIPDCLEAEVRPIRFNRSGDKIACLLDNGNIEVWSLNGEKPTKTLTYPSQATGIYWGEALVGVSGEKLIFLNEDGTLIHACDKKAQIEAYEEIDNKGAIPSEMEDQLSYTWKNKYAWPTSWRKK